MEVIQRRESQRLIFPPRAAGPRHGLPGEAVAAPSLAGFKARLDGALSSLGWWKGPCSWQRGWNQMVCKVPSNPNHSMIFWEPKSFRGTEPDSLPRFDTGSWLQPLGTARRLCGAPLASPPWPARSQLNLRQGVREGTEWGDYTNLCPNYSLGLFVTAASKILFSTIPSTLSGKNLSSLIACWILWEQAMGLPEIPNCFAFCFFSGFSLQVTHSVTY